MDVREHRLPPAQRGELREFIDQHLGELLDLPLSHSGQVGRKGEIDRVPADHAREVPLERRPEADHVGQQDLGVAGRAGDRHGMGQLEAEPLEVLERLEGAVGPVDVAQAVEVQIAIDMGVADIPGEDVVESVFPLDPLDKGQTRPFGGVRNVGILLVPVENKLTDIIERKAEARMKPAGLFQPPLDQLGVHELADQRRRQQADPG